ncbi:TldD/PmbA family protein [Candidatus Micrarchaeota archaeon]|nr:TldD/PmbA family protein [Candidatus Micrarchaeota archaeon]
MIEKWKFTNYSVSFVLNNGEPKISRKKYQGVSARVFDKSFGFASSNNMSDNDVVVEKAKKLAKSATGNENYKIVKKPKEKHFDSIMNAPEYDFEQIMEQLKELDKPIKNLNSRTLRLISKFTVKEYEDSNGNSLVMEDIFSYFSVIGVAKSRSIMESWSEREGWLGKINESKLSKFADKVLKTKEKSEALLSAEHAPKGKTTVVLDPEMTGLFTHEAVGHACEADYILNGSSVLIKPGEKVGSSLVKITDYPEYPKCFGNIKFDDEGVKCKPVILIDKGILKNYLHSSMTAGTLGSELTGNARMEDYDSPPIVRMRNTILEASDTKNTLKDDEIFDIEKGIYVYGMRGGAVSPITGSFMFGAKEAYKIENGELTTHLRDLSLTGNIKQTLHNIEAVGRKIGTGPGYCGKEGQNVRVSDGGPVTRVKDMVIG